MMGTWIVHIYIYSSGLMVGFSSLHLSLWPLSDLLEHYPLVVWGVFAGFVAVAVYRDDVLGGGVVVLPLSLSQTPLPWLGCHSIL